MNEYNLLGSQIHVKSNQGLQILESKDQRSLVPNMDFTVMESSRGDPGLSSPWVADNWLPSPTSYFSSDTLWSGLGEAGAPMHFLRLLDRLPSPGFQQAAWWWVLEIAGGGGYFAWDPPSLMVLELGLCGDKPCLLSGPCTFPLTFSPPSPSLPQSCPTQHPELGERRSERWVLLPSWHPCPCASLDSKSILGCE